MLRSPARIRPLLIPIVTALAAFCARAAAQTAPAPKVATEPTQATTTAGATGPATGPAATILDERTAWRRVWAYRAARAKAAAELSGRIAALKLAGGAELPATVGELLKDAPRAAAALDATLLMLAPVEAPVHRDDGTCELTLTISRADLAAALKGIVAGYYGGRDAEAVAGKLALADADGQPLSATARSAPPPALPAPELIAWASGQDYFDRAPEPVRAFWTAHVPADARRAAEQAARDDATARLTRRLAEVYLDPATSLPQWLAARGAAEPDLTAFLRAAGELGARYHADAAVVEIEVRVSLRTVYACLKAWVHANRPDAAADIRRLEQLIVAAGDRAITQIGLAAVRVDDQERPAPSAETIASFVQAAPAWVGQHLLERTVLPRDPEEAAPSASATRRPSSSPPRAGEGRPEESPSPPGGERTLRIAELDARTALAVRAAKLPLDGQTVEEFFAARPDGRKHLLAVLAGARQTAGPHLTETAAGVAMELPLEPLWRIALDGKVHPPKR